MQVLVDAREKLGIPWEQIHSEKAAQEAKTFQTQPSISTQQFMNYAPMLHTLWQDRGIRQAYDRRREFQIVITRNSHSTTETV